VEIGVDLGFDEGDFRADFGDDIVGAALGVGIELDEEVADVGFGKFQPQGDARAAGVAFDFGVSLRMFSISMSERLDSERLVPAG